MEYHLYLPLLRGDEVLIFGKLSKGKARPDHPETEIIENDEDATIHVNRIVPVTHTEGLSQRAAFHARHCGEIFGAD